MVGINVSTVLPCIKENHMDGMPSVLKLTAFISYPFIEQSREVGSIKCAPCVQPQMFSLIYLDPVDKFNSLNTKLLNNESFKY